jgi:hypothetical protein
MIKSAAVIFGKILAIPDDAAALLCREIVRHYLMKMEVHDRHYFEIPTYVCSFAIPMLCTYVCSHTIFLRFQGHVVVDHTLMYIVVITQNT